MRKCEGDRKSTNFMTQFKMHSNFKTKFVISASKFKSNSQIWNIIF